MAQRNCPEEERLSPIAVLLWIATRVITENGKRRKISKLDAAVTQLANDAARGDKKSIQLAFALLQALEPAIDAQRPVYFLGGVLAQGDRTLNGGDSLRAKVMSPIGLAA